MASCFHCGTTSEAVILITLKTKTICLNCLCTRHPKTSLDILEFILDAESKGLLNK